MAPSKSFRYLVNYVSGLDKYKFGIQNIMLVLDNEKISFINNKFDFLISFDKIAAFEFIKSPFKMPDPLSPVNLNVAYTYFRIYYFDNNCPKSILFMMNTFADDSFENNEDACKDLFYKLLDYDYYDFTVTSPWGENKYDIQRLKIKKIYHMSYLGGHPDNHHKFSRVDFYVLNDRFYVDKYINEKKFSAFEIPFNKIKLFELADQKHLSLIKRFFSLGTKTNKSDTCHIVFTNTKNIDVSVYFSMLAANTSPDHLNELIRSIRGNTDDSLNQGTVL